MDFRIQVGLPQAPAGLSDRDASLVTPLYRAIHSLANQVSVATGHVTYSASDLTNLDRAGGLTAGASMQLSIVAGEALGFGELLTLSVSGGNIVAHKATAADLAKPALAACDTDGGIPIGQAGRAVFLEGRLLGITGTSFGTPYYLGTAGTVTATPPTADGVLRQFVGIGLGSAGFYLALAPMRRAIWDIVSPSAGVLRVQYTDGSHTDHVV